MMGQDSGQSDYQKIKFDNYLNTMLAYSVEIDNFIKDGWKVLDILTGSNTDLKVYLIGYPKTTIPRFEQMYMENRNETN